MGVKYVKKGVVVLFCESLNVGTWIFDEVGTYYIVLEGLDVNGLNISILDPVRSGTGL